MPTNESVRLDLKVDGRDSVKGAAADVKDLGETYALVERQVVQTRGQILREFQRLQSQEQAFQGFLSSESDGVRRSSGRFDRLRDSLRGYGKGAEDAGKRTADLSRFMMHLSQSSQDLVQGGFGAILNNLPQLAEGAAKSSKLVEKLAGAFGGPAGLASAAMFGGLALYTLPPLFQSVWAAMNRGVEEFPKTRDGLKSLREEIKENEKSLEELKESWDGTAASLAKANELIAENERLEKEADAERERRANAKSMKDREDKAKLNERAAKTAFKELEKAGGYEKVVAGVTAINESKDGGLSAASGDLAKAQEALKATDSDYGTAKYNAANGTFPGATTELKRIEAERAKLAKTVHEAQAKVDAAKKRAKDSAQDLVDRVLKGDQSAIPDLALASPDGKATPYMGFANASKTMQERDDQLLRKFEAGNQRDAEIGAAQKKARETRARRKRQDEEIEEAGKSTPDELKQSEMMDFIDRNLRRLAPKMDRLTSQQSIDASDLALKYESAGASRPEAATAAFRDLRERDRKLRDEAATASGGGPASARLSADADLRREEMTRRAAEVAREDFPMADPRVLQGLAREAAENAAGPDVGSIRQALQTAVGQAQAKWQNDLNRQMQRMWVGSESYVQ